MHGIDSCLMGRLVTCIKALLNSLDYYNRVIYHRTDNQHKGKQRKQVDRESCRLHKGKRTDKRHDDAYRRNECGAEVLQEKVNHYQHQQDGDNQCLDNLVHRCKEEVVGIVERQNRYILRKGLLYLLQQFVDVLINLRGIRACCLTNLSHHARMTIHTTLVDIVGLSQFDISHILQA